jgi:hypothetical protein
MAHINHRRRTVRRVVTAIGALAMASGTIALTAAPASAWSLPQLCTGAAEANTCLSGHTDIHAVQVHVGIDVYMSRADAEALIAQPGNALSAAMYGDDGSTEQFLFDLTPTFESAGDTGIGAEFDMFVPASWLDEDSSWCDLPWCNNRDEVFARVTLTDARTGWSRTFDTQSWSINAQSI